MSLSGKHLRRTPEEHGLPVGGRRSWKKTNVVSGVRKGGRKDIDVKKIVLTGGGTAGHVTPNIALIEKLKAEGYEISYIGSKGGIEKRLIERIGIPYYGVSTGKLRRYLSLKNISDIFKVFAGMRQAKKLLKKLKPDVLFSKGGFVAVPVVHAAAKRKIPVVIHESDMTPGLANRLCIKKARTVCCNFPETMKYLPEGKSVHTGTPIRKALFDGKKERGLEIAGFDGSKPVLMIMGGSSGAMKVNEVLRSALPALLNTFDIIHLCGKGRLEESLADKHGYKQFEYVDEDLKDLFAAADVMISRAGANAVCELLALKKPAVLIPLSAAASRGDQILNAKSFEKAGYSFVLPEEIMTPDTVIEAAEKVYDERDRYIAAMNKSEAGDATDKIISILDGIIESGKVE